MTPEQQDACQADVNRVLAELGRTDAVGKVRAYPEWADEAGFIYPPCWVVEVRFGKGEGKKVWTTDADWHPRLRAYWVDLFQREVAEAGAPKTPHSPRTP